MFDLRVVFDDYFSGALPPPDAVPAEYRNTDGETQQILALPGYSGIRTAPRFARTITFGTFILNGLRQRSSRNAFDSRDAIFGAPRTTIR